MKILGIILLIFGFIGIFISRPLSIKLEKSGEKEKRFNAEISIKVIFLILTIVGSLLTVLN